MIKTIHRIISFGILFLCCSPVLCLAQQNRQAHVDKWTQQRLDREAKEREELVYQSVLQDANRHFEEKDYQAARSLYQQALDQRPHDTKVQAKIEDLDIIISNLSASEPTVADEVIAQEDPGARDSIQSAFPERSAVPEFITARTETTVQALEPKSSLRQEKVTTGTVQMPNEPVVKDSLVPAKEGPGKEGPENIEAFQKELARQYPDGITEETYKEGSATILKRIIVLNNRGNEYKKVVHTWGGIFYFKNEMPTTERVWFEETEKVKNDLKKH